jgi:hypothetical protein
MSKIEELRFFLKSDTRDEEEAEAQEKANSRLLAG